MSLVSLYERPEYGESYLPWSLGEYYRSLASSYQFGDEKKVWALLGKSTAYIERTHLTMRLFNGRLTRKTPAFLKSLEMYRASAAWEDLVCNLARPLKTLRVRVFDNPYRRWKPCTPAIAAGLTDHIWTVKELLTTVVPPNNT